MKTNQLTSFEGIELGDSEGLDDGFAAAVDLILNATEWAGVGASGPALVRVSLVQESGLTGIRIEDSGPGIPTTEQQRIFQDRVRLPQTSGSTSGFGVGLAVCRRISSSRVSSILNRANTGPLPGAMKSMSAALSQTM